MSGKMQGSLYKVWIDPKKGKHYSLPKAKKAGFTDDAPRVETAKPKGKGKSNKQKKAG